MMDVALTFDDGPSDLATGRILDLLAKSGYRATFFVIGERISGRSAILRRAIADGHEIGNHSWSHKNMTKLNLDEVKAEISSTNRAIQDSCGTTPVLFRPPFGRTNTTVDKMAAENNLKRVLWNIDSMDWNDRCGNQISTKVINEVRNGSVILLHDIYNSTADAVEAISSSFKEREIQSITLSHLRQNILK
ncbi:hypothetical protein BH09VER1_BH09VER1_54960 [soil metagenome]